MRSDIEFILFDIGKVLVNFSFEHFRLFLKDQGARLETTQDFIDQTRLHDYETGVASSQEFVARIQSLLARPVAYDDIASRWQEIFQPEDKMIELARKLAQEYQVALLSNTSELHWSYLCREYQLDKIGLGTVTSFEAGAMKPANRIFDHAEKKFGLNPNRTLFIFA